VLAKVETTRPTVIIYDLAGRQVRAVASGTDGFRWNGLDDEGQLAPPGAYLCRITLDADVGEEAAHRMINVVY
jgi:flagellar hook assembly protein FlgD